MSLPLQQLVWLWGQPGTLPTVCFPGEMWGTPSLQGPGCTPRLPPLAAVGHSGDTRLDETGTRGLGQGDKPNRQLWGPQKSLRRSQKSRKHASRRLVGHSCLMDASQYRAGAATHAPTAASSPWPWLWPHLDLASKISPLAWHARTVEKDVMALACLPVLQREKSLERGHVH